MNACMVTRPSSQKEWLSYTIGQWTAREKEDDLSTLTVIDINIRIVGKGNAIQELSLHNNITMHSQRTHKSQASLKIAV